MVRTWSRPYGLCHHPYTKAHIKGFGSSYLHVYACLLLCFMLVLASLVLGFTMLDALRGFDLVWLHSTPMRPCLDVTIWEVSPDARLLRTYPSLFLSVRCYAYHVCLCHPLAFYASLQACSHVHAWVLLAIVSSMLQHNKVMDPNLHLSLVDTTFCFAFLLVCLLACLLAFLFLCLPCLSCLSALCLFHMPFASFLPLLVCWFLVFAMYTYGVRVHGAKVRSPRHKRKWWGCEHVDISQAAMFSRFGGLAFPIWLCTLLNPFPSSLISLLDGLY